MDRKDQMPAGGCGNCGAHAEETQSMKRKKLEWDGQTWLCKACTAQGKAV